MSSGRAQARQAGPGPDPVLTGRQTRARFGPDKLRQVMHKCKGRKGARKGAQANTASKTANGGAAAKRSNGSSKLAAAAANRQISNAMQQQSKLAATARMMIRVRYEAMMMTGRVR